MSSSRTDSRRRGWRVYWLHPTSSDRCAGTWWPNRGDAEMIAATLRRAGCREVTIRSSLGCEDEC